jgi:hypothetical protein
MAWSAELSERLRMLWDQGIVTREIAALPEFAGITRNAIIGRANRMELNPRNTGRYQEMGGEERARQTAKIRKKARKDKPRVPFIMPPRPRFDKPGTVSLIDAALNQCRWIGHDKLCCGDATYEGSSWCPSHHWVVYRKGTAFRGNRPLPWAA